MPAEFTLCIKHFLTYLGHLMNTKALVGPVRGSSDEKILVHICAHQEFMVTKYLVSESCILQCFLKFLLSKERFTSKRCKNFMCQVVSHDMCTYVYMRMLRHKALVYYKIFLHGPI